MSALDQLRNYLLPKTLEYAVKNSPFYAERFGDAWQRVQTVADLPELPILDKPTALEHQEAMRCGEDPGDFGAVSSGTTRVGSELLSVQHCFEELEALEEYEQMLTRDGEDVEPPEPVLHIITPNHGLPFGPPPVDTVRLAWCYSANICEMVEQALRTPVGGRRITVMRASTSVLKQLTTWLLERGVDPRELGVRAIGTNAAMVTRRWRALFETHWGARIFDNYSISEIITPATECEACGWHHFGAPPLAFEVVDPSHGHALERGVGQLLLTGLYPYVQRQPLIRYASGDLVELGPRCEAADDVGIRFRGRMHQTLMAATGSGTEYLLFPTLLEDLADDYPEITRLHHASERVGLIPPQSVGIPKVAATLDGATVRVEIGVRFLPSLHPDRAEDLTDDLCARLLATHPALAERVRTGDAALEVTARHADPDDDAGWFVKHLM